MDKLILIGGGHGESGTNFMRRLLCSHSDIGWIAKRDTFIMEELANWLPYIAAEDNHYLPRLASIKYGEFRDYVGHTFGFNAGVRAALDRLEKEIADVAIYVSRFGAFPLVRPHEREPRARIIRAFLNGIFSASSTNPRALYGCEKTPSNAQFISLAYELLPTSRMIVLHRHPIDLALSLLPFDWGPDDPIEAAHFTHSYLSRWHSVRHRVPSDYFITVKFEDLQESPQQTLVEVFAFLEISIERSVLDAIDSILRPAPNLRSEVSASTLRAMREVLAESCHNLGYETRGRQPRRVFSTKD